MFFRSKVFLCMLYEVWALVSFFIHLVVVISLIKKKNVKTQFITFASSCAL